MYHLHPPHPAPPLCPGSGTRNTRLGGTDQRRDAPVETHPTGGWGSTAPRQDRGWHPDPAPPAEPPRSHPFHITQRWAEKRQRQGRVGGQGGEPQPSARKARLQGPDAQGLLRPQSRQHYPTRTAAVLLQPEYPVRAQLRKRDFKELQ